jgi:uncharacterized protein (DUF2141 family)
MKLGHVFLGIFLMVCPAAMYAGDIPVTLEFQGIVPGGGTVYVAIFYRADSFKKQIPEYALSVEPAAETVRAEISLPEGDCIVSCYQDANGNVKMDSGIFGMPKELIGLTNYDGKGMTGGFKKLTVPVNRDTGVITVRLYKVRI